MTGYGRGQARFEGLVIEVEVSSVNRRQLDVHTSLPRPLQVLEPRVLEALSSFVSRGRVSVNVAVLSGGGRQARRVSVDLRLARTYLDAARRAGRELGVSDDLGLSHVLALPDVVRIEHPEEDVERIWPPLEAAVQQAMRRVVRMRRAEGRALSADLSARFARLGEGVDGLEQRAPLVAEHYRAALVGRLRSAGFAAEADDGRVLRELALFADRADISEELTRLRSHLRQARALLRSREPAGRALDFLAQELFREINTVGSKAGDAEIDRGRRRLQGRAGAYPRTGAERRMNAPRNERPLLLVVSAPSGAGKTTLCDRLLEAFAGMRYSVSCTTRPPREGERDGIDYRFLDEEAFRARAGQGAFLEYARVHGHGYGTPREPIDAALAAGCDVLLDIDVQGAAQVRDGLRAAPPEDPLRLAYVDVFVAPPSVDELRRRLVSRGKDAPEVIERRVRQAGREMACAGAYRYRLVNDRLEEAFDVLRAIVLAERHRVLRG